MGERSSIEWTDATWNPTTGCTKVSPGCDNCYALGLAHGRLAQNYSRVLPVVPTPENIADPFAVRLRAERLTQPEHWRERKVIFVNSMSDLFHVDVPEQYLLQIFDVMLRVDRHIYQVLTKRPARAARFFDAHPELLTDGLLPEHIWIGTSIENQAYAYRQRQLSSVPAAVRFLSCEPLLGPLDLDLGHIHWVIVGGESGLEFRPVDEAWVRSIRDQCETAGVPFFFKQWGGRTPKARGRILDGRTYDCMPAKVELAGLAAGNMGSSE